MIFFANNFLYFECTHLVLLVWYRSFRDSFSALESLQCRYIPRCNDWNQHLKAHKLCQAFQMMIQIISDDQYVNSIEFSILSKFVIAEPFLTIIKSNRIFKI